MEVVHTVDVADQLPSLQRRNLVMIIVEFIKDPSPPDDEYRSDGP